MTDLPRIQPASPEARREVLTLACNHLSAEDRDERTVALMGGIESNKTLLDGLLEARRGGRLVGGILSEVQPGKTAVVWPPRLVPGEPAATGEQLLAVTLELLHAKRVCVAYTLLETGTENDAPVLRAAGFEPLADLLYLASMKKGFPHSRPASPLEFEAYSAANHDRMARVVEATYDGTCDCPRLNGVRQVDDILTGYRATGAFAPDRWLIVRHQGEDVGCLLLADHPEQESWELVYMGLTPVARGNGWGKEITRHAQWLTRQAGRARLLLAVDQENDPAIRVYWTQGFQAWDRRSVYLRVLS